MKKRAVGPHHIEKLQQYGIKDIPIEELVLLQYDKGEEIVQEGFPMAYLLILITGSAKVYMTASNGRDLLVAYYLEEGMIGDIELMLGNYTASTTMVALNRFVCIGIPIGTWGEQLKKNNVFMNYVGRELASKLLRSSHVGTMNTLLSGEDRICRYLLQIEKKGLVDEKLTNIASAVGISYRHTLRVLKHLCEQNILQKKDKGYLIIDKEKLK